MTEHLSMETMFKVEGACDFLLDHWVEWEVEGSRATFAVSSKPVFLLQLVTACAMQAFHSLFHAKPTLGTLSAELNAQIITVSLKWRWR